MWVKEEEELKESKLGHKSQFLRIFQLSFEDL